SAPGPSVIGRPSRHCVLEVRRIQNIGWTKRFKSLFGQPAIEHLHQPPTQHVRLHDAAIEQNMRRACQTVSPTPNVASFRTVLYLMGQKARQVLYDEKSDTFRCPAGQTLWRKQFSKKDRAVTYTDRK